MTNRENYDYNKLVARAAQGMLTLSQEKEMNELGRKKIAEMTAANNAPETPVSESGGGYEWDLKNNSIERLGSSD